MNNEEFINILNKAANCIEKDIAAHEKYLAEAAKYPSLEYHHYVAMVKLESDISYHDWTVRLNVYGVQLQKNTTAENYFIFTTRKEATAAAKKLCLVNVEGKRVNYVYNVVTCHEWHNLRIASKRAELERIKKLVSDARVAA